MMPKTPSQKIHKSFYFIVLLIITIMVFTSCNVKSQQPSYSPSNKVEGSSPSTQAVQAGTHDVSVMFINLGRADATLIKIDGKSFLIDTGEKQSVPALYRALEACNVQDISAVFLTHTHADHIGGLAALTQKYKVDKLYSAHISINNKNGENKIVKLAEELSLPLTRLEAGQKVDLVPGIYFEVLGPLVLNSEEDNENSLVMRLKVNGKTFLFTGDMQFAEEQTLIKSGVDLSADVLKVANHGNPDATSKAFAEAVSPKIAVIPTDTSADTDSANERVKSSLHDAKIYVTQDYACGVLLDISGAAIQASDPKPKAKNADIQIVNIDKDAQTVTLKNNGSKTDISGYIIYSQRGSETFIFPPSSVVDAGQTFTVACTGGSGDFIWNDKKVWNAKKDDAATLYDKYGNVLSQK